MSEHVLLTGATGLVGQYLLRDLLLREVPVAVLIRSRAKEPARERVEAILNHWEEEQGRALPRPVCLEGDITSPGLGLDDETWRWAAGHCRQVLHNAASLTFLGKDRDRDPWLSNQTGTARLLDFCRQAGLRELHYVSTAYVCGRRTGLIFEEELDCGQEFRNDYEASKFEAEKLVRSATFLDSLTVYRPAVVVGDSVTGYTSTYHGLYSYLQFTWTLGQYAPRDENGRWHAPVRLNLTGAEHRNLVPVDWVSAVITHLFLTSRHHGRTYHLTPVRPVTARQIEEAMSDHFRYYGPTFAGPNALAQGDLNELEKTFYEYVARYEPYWAEEPTFDCAHTLAAAPHLPCPPTDAPLIRRLIDYAIADRWGKRRH
jgi:thioester reductase-like protein